MSLNLRPDIEERLRGLGASNGVSLETFLQQLVDETAGTAAQPRLSAGEWSHQLEEWADSFPEAPPIPDEEFAQKGAASHL